MQSYILYGVPQGSVLGLILFLLYTADLIKLVKVRNLHPHLYAVDTQLLLLLPARRYASAGNSDRNVSVCPSVRHAPVLCQNEES